MADKKRLGISFSGGGLKVISYIGALKALEELGIKADAVSGTSSGSLLACLYAMGYTVDEIIECAEESARVLATFSKRKMFKVLQNFLTKGQSRCEGLADGERIENLIAEFAKKKGIDSIRDVDMDLAIATIDTYTMNECIFLSKKYNLQNDDIEYIYDAPIGLTVRASMAFPGIYTTCNFEKHNFIDGGTKDNLPVKVLKDIGINKVIAINLDLSNYYPDGNLETVVLRALDTYSIENVKKARKMSDISIEIADEESNLIKIENIENSINVGYRTVMRHKDRLLKLKEELEG